MDNHVSNWKICIFAQIRIVSYRLAEMFEPRKGTKPFDGVHFMLLNQYLIPVSLKTEDVQAVKKVYQKRSKYISLGFLIEESLLDLRRGRQIFREEEGLDEQVFGDKFMIWRLLNSDKGIAVRSTKLTQLKTGFSYDQARMSSMLKIRGRMVIYCRQQSMKKDTKLGLLRLKTITVLQLEIINYLQVKALLNLKKYTEVVL